MFASGKRVILRCQPLLSFPGNSVFDYGQLLVKGSVRSIQVILKRAFLDEVAFLAAKVGKYLESVLDFKSGKIDLHVYVTIENQVVSDGFARTGLPYFPQISRSSRVERISRAWLLFVLILIPP